MLDEEALWFEKVTKKLSDAIQDLELDYGVEYGLITGCHAIGNCSQAEVCDLFCRNLLPHLANDGRIVLVEEMSNDTIKQATGGR